MTGRAVTNNTARKRRTRRPRSTPRTARLLQHSSFLIVALVLTGCGAITPRVEPAPAPVARAPDARPAPAKPPTPRGGGYYLDDGPGDNPPPNLDQIPDATPRAEPLHRGAMRPYSVMGKSYTPMTQVAPYKARGIASWYGRRYHGRQTSTGEIYDMYAMTGAHTVLPLPSYVRVTNLQNMKSVIVRINDRGPFHSDRLIDLSYTAAYKLGVLSGGSTLVEVETVLPGTVPPPAAAATPAASSSANVIVASALPSTRSPSRVALEPVDPVNTAPVAIQSELTAPPSSAGGVFLQLGAFGSQENADSYLTRIRAQLDGFGTALGVHLKDGYYRVQAGPYANAAEARAMAERIGQSLGAKPLLVTR